MIGSGRWRLRPRRRGHPNGGRSAVAEAGYNLVVLAVAITVLNILAAKALPLWSHLIQRDKEEELIFRGLQYAEAIRVFERRAQRLPTRLEELIESKPRCIRQLWENPMTENGAWGLVFQDQPGQDPQGRGRRRQTRQERQQQQQQAFGVPGDGQEVRVGPIIGVYSPEGGEAIKVFAPPGGGGGSEISEWKFTRDLTQWIAGQQVVAQGTETRVPSMNSALIGKPWPPGINLPQMQGMPGQRPGGIGANLPGRRQGGRRPGAQQGVGRPGTQQGGGQPGQPPQGRDLGGGGGG